MLKSIEAKLKVQAHPEVSRVEAIVDYGNLFVCRVTRHSDEEEDFDPFFSVDKSTGQVKEFSILEDGDIRELTILFLAAEDY